MRSPAFAPRIRAPRRVAGGAALLLFLSACTGSSGQEEADSSKMTSDQTTAAAGTTSESQATSAAPTTAAGNSLDTAPFDITQDWSILQDIPKGDVTIKTYEQCTSTDPKLDPAQGPWTDAEGQREPAANENPFIVYADGSCNDPVTEDYIGGYNTPQQIGPAPVVLHNGDPIGVECVSGGDPIQDVRGPRSSSDAWIGGVVLQDGELKWTFVPETNAGYVDEDAFPKC